MAFSPGHLESITFWFDVSGAVVEFGVAIAAAIIAHKEFGKEREEILENYIAIFAGIAAFLVLSTALLNHRVSVLREQEAKQSQDRYDALLRAKDAEVANAQNDASNALTKASELEVKMRAKPLSERLMAFCYDLDKRILPALTNGTTRFHGFFTQTELSELQKMARVPESQKYLSIEYGSVTKALKTGMATEATLKLSPNLIYPP